MALLNGWTGKSGWTGPVNRIDFEPQATFSVQVGFAAPAGIWYTIFNDITQARYCFVGMDKDTAIACAAANHYPASGINARAFLALRAEHGSFDAYIWTFTGGGPLQRPAPVVWNEVAATTPESDAMSKALKKAGMTFVGSTICYAFMQAAGMVNDHLAACPAR